MPAEAALDEVARLRSLPALDRKLELTCRPLAVSAAGHLWQYVELLHDPGGYGGRFSSIATVGETLTVLMTATMIGEAWHWEVYADGSRLLAGGRAGDMVEAMTAAVAAALKAAGDPMNIGDLMNVKVDAVGVA